MKILAVDISLIFSINWEASEGKEMGAAFKRTVDAVTAARVGYDRCFLACDSGPSFRKQVPEYKINRTDRGEAYRAQLQRTIERLQADGCAVIVAPAVGTFPATGATSYAEADDVLGWAAWQFSERVAALSEEERAEWSLTILSDDSDLEQLVDDEAGVEILKTSLRGGERWDEAKVLEKRFVRPDRIADLKAFTGDDTDDYDGFCGELMAADPMNPKAKPRHKPGIGPKTAASLIAKYGGALETFDNGNPQRWEADGAKDAVRATLARHGRALAEKGLFLATICHELPGLDFGVILAEPVAKKIAQPVEFKEDPTAAHREQRQAPTSTSIVAAPPASLLDPSQADWALSLQPRSTLEAMELAKHLFNSRLFSKFGNAEAIFAIIMVGRERGISTMIALTSIHMIEGKPELSADLIVAQVLRSGKAKRFTCIETTDERAVYLVQRYDDAEPMRIEFTKAHAVARGLWGKGNWIKMPDVMLAHRCATKAARLKFADVTVGLYGEGEIREARPGVLDAEFEV